MIAVREEGMKFRRGKMHSPFLKKGKDKSAKKKGEYRLDRCKAWRLDNGLDALDANWTSIKSEGILRQRGTDLEYNTKLVARLNVGNS